MGKGGYPTAISTFQSEDIDTGTTIQMNRSFGEMVQYLDKKKKSPEDISLDDIKRNRYTTLFEQITILFDKIESDFTPEQIVEHLKKLDETEHKESTKRGKGTFRVIR